MTDNPVSKEMKDRGVAQGPQDKPADHRPAVDGPKPTPEDDKAGRTASVAHTPPKQA